MPYLFARLWINSDSLFLPCMLYPAVPTGLDAVQWEGDYLSLCARQAAVEREREKGTSSKACKSCQSWAAGERRTAEQGPVQYLVDKGGKTVPRISLASQTVPFPR